MIVVRAGLLAAVLASPLAAQGGGNGTFYITTYSRATYVIPESTMTVAHKIPFDAGLPIGITLTMDRKRLYVEDAPFERMRVYDVATRALVDSFQLSSGATKVRIVGFGLDPKERFAILLIKATTRKPDRFEIGKSILVRYDLAKHAVTDTIPWPKNEEREFAGFQFSPDGNPDRQRHRIAHGERGFVDDQHLLVIGAVIERAVATIRGLGRKRACTEERKAQREREPIGAFHGKIRSILRQSFCADAHFAVQSGA